MNFPPDCVALADYLRTATRRAHRGLDHHPILNALLQTDLTRAAYARALAALYAPQQALEAWLADFVPLTELPPRLPDLAVDLAELGCDPHPLATPLPAWSSSISVRLGCAYVIEGANLGGAVIARQLPDGLPRRFFAGAGGEPRWQRFWLFASQFGITSAQDMCSTAQAAQECFAWYRAHLDGCVQP